MDPLKVCVVSAYLNEGNGYRDSRGETLEGTARISHELAIRLCGLGHAVVGITDGPKPKTTRTQRNYELRTLEERFSFRNLTRLRELVKSIRPDIIHFHGGELMSYYAALLGRQSPPKIFTFTFIPSVARQSKDIALKYVLSVMSKLRKSRMKSLTGFAHVIALTEFAKQELEHELPGVPVSLVRYGVAEQYLNPTDVPTEDGKSRDVICTSGVTPGRGFDTFLSSIPIIEEKCRDVNFMVAIRDNRDAIGVPPGIRVLGPGQFLDLVKLHSIVLMPYSKHVAVDPPLSMLECMALGKTVVSTSIGSVPEVLASSRGVVVPSRNPAALARSTCELLEDDSLKTSIGLNAQQYVKKQYDWNLALSSFQRIYKQVASGPDS